MRPQLINDAGDRPGTTKTSLVWTCDRCRMKTIAESPPEKWQIDEAVDLSICPECLEK